MKKILLNGLLIIGVLTFMGCSKEGDKDLANALENAPKWNITTVSLLPTTKELGVEKCSEVININPFPTKADIANEKECAANARQRAEEDKSYFYQYNEDTKMMCRNIPEFFKYSWSTEEAYPLKKHNNEERKIQNATKINGVVYFNIDEESVTGNPIITTEFIKFGSKEGRYYTKTIKCELVDVQEQLKVKNP